MKLLHLIGEISADTVEPVVLAIDSLTARDEYAVLKIASEGGNVDYAQAVIASMCSAAVPVHTYGFGGIASAAIDILAVGVTRGLHPFVTGMTHGSNTRMTDGKAAAAVEEARDKRLYATNSIVLENWSFLFGKRKRWHTPEALIRYGLADYIADRPRVPIPAQ